MEAVTSYYRFLTAVLYLIANLAFAQTPVVSMVQAKEDRPQIVTLKGSNFGTQADDLSVYFGAAKGTVQMLTPKYMEVLVPAGATFSKISVTSKTTGLTGYSNLPFFPTFSGEHGFENSSLQGQLDFNAESGLYDLCLCDFDGDGKNDIGASNQNSTDYALFKNTTTSPGLNNISFSKIKIDLEKGSLHTKCGDINGDGRPDIVASESQNGTSLFILLNISSGSGHIAFEKRVINLFNIKPKRIDIADLNLDGRPEIVVTNQTGNSIAILKNTGDISNPFSNSARQDIVLNDLPSDRGLDALSIQDLNGDQRPDIVVSQFQRAVSNLYIIPNKTNEGQFTFATPIMISLSGTAVSVNIADIDQDGKPDIAASLLLNSSIAILKNKSSVSNFSFDAPVEFATNKNPFGFDFADLDGDGKLDIIVSSIDTRAIKILNNQSTPGHLSFSSITQNTTYISRHIAAGDIDGDAKPDICFASVDDNTNGVLASKVSVFRNGNCIIPTVSPGGELKICTGVPLQLATFESAGLTYSWVKNGTSLNEETAQLEVTESGTFWVTVEGDNCVNESNKVIVEFSPSPENLTTEINEPGSLCDGNTLELSANQNISLAEYKWTGPANYTATGHIADPAVDNFSIEKAGKYTLQIFKGNCLARETSIIVDVNEVPDFALDMAPEVFICDTQTKTISVDPAPETYSYQWYEKTKGLLTGETNNELTVSENGEYFLIATGSIACATAQTASTILTFTESPVALFDAPSTACVNDLINFTNTSTSSMPEKLSYKWEFGDGESSTAVNPQHAFSEEQMYNIKLKVSYTNGQCATYHTANLTTRKAPEVNIIDPAGSYLVCPDASVQLTVNGAFAAYEWSNGAVTPDVLVDEPGFYDVKVTASDGCTATASIELSAAPPTVISVHASPAEVVQGQSTTLSAEGLLDYQWFPSETLDDDESATPIATPIENTVYMVTGTDENGCDASGQVEVRVKAELAGAKLVPKKYFSPNNDATNHYWIIEKITDYPQCDVTVFNDKGVKVFQAQPYNNDWDGTIHGKPLVEGVYFYIIKCQGEEKTPVTGSVTLLR